MKFIKLIALAACVFLRVGSAWAADIPSVQSFNQMQAPRVSTATGLIDLWQVTRGSGKLISLFGYNSSTQQWVQVFDTTNGPTLAVNGFDSGNSWFTNGSGSLGPGDGLRITNTFAGLSAGIYFAQPVGANRFYLMPTRDLAVNGSFLDALAISGSSSGTGFMRVPVHSFAVDGTNNFSCIVPVTGIPVGRGVCIATSQTGGALYTPGGTNITANVTVGSP